MTRLMRCLATVAVGLVTVTAVACGGDDDSASTTKTTTTTTRISSSTTQTTGAPAATCSASKLSTTVIPESQLPAAVAAMRSDLARAAASCDYDALATLADRGGRAVRFSWGDESDPVAFWKGAEAANAPQPAPLRALRLLLDLPATATDAGNGTTQYVWPPAFATEHPTDAQLQQIAGTGLYDMATLRGWVDQGTNYLGYRVLITESGDWTAFVSGD